MTLNPPESVSDSPGPHFEKHCAGLSNNGPSRFIFQSKWVENVPDLCRTGTYEYEDGVIDFDSGTVVFEIDFEGDSFEIENVNIESYNIIFRDMELERQ